MSQAPTGPVAHLSSSPNHSHLLFCLLHLTALITRQSFCSRIFQISNLTAFCCSVVGTSISVTFGYVRQSEIDRRNQNLGNRDTERDQQIWLGAEYAQLHRHSSLCFSALPFSTITLLNAISPVKLNQLVMTLILKLEVACDLLVCMLGPSSTTLR